MKTLTDFRKIGKKKLNGRTPEEAFAIHQQRQKNKTNILPSAIQWVRNPDRKSLPFVGLITNDMIPSPVRYKRAQNWRTPKLSFCKTEELCYNMGRYSFRCTFNKYEYVQYVESWGLFIGRNLYYTIHTKNGIIKGWLTSPRGWSWKKINTRLAIVNKRGDEYHLLASEIFNGKNGTWFAAQARNNGNIRRQEKRQSALLLANERAILSCVGVTMQDARRAGNCAAGILDFCRDRFNYEHEQNNIYKNFSAKLLKKIGGERVENAIKRAIERATLVCI